jgi:hypothetical protein
MHIRISEMLIQVSNIGQGMSTFYGENYTNFNKTPHKIYVGFVKQQAFEGKDCQACGGGITVTFNIRCRSPQHESIRFSKALGTESGKNKQFC